MTSSAKLTTALKETFGLKLKRLRRKLKNPLKDFRSFKQKLFCLRGTIFKVPEDMKWKKWFNQSELVGTALLLCWTEQSFKLPEYSQLYL
jgi:hypothetical protein